MGGGGRAGIKGTLGYRQLETRLDSMTSGLKTQKELGNKMKYWIRGKNARMKDWGMGRCGTHLSGKCEDMGFGPQHPHNS